MMLEKKKVKPIRLSLLPNEIKKLKVLRKEALIYSNYFTINFRGK